MHSTLLRYPGCKWSKHLALEKKPSLQSYLPQTDLFSKDSFIQFINKFPVVFLKPSLGGGGHGVFKISKLRNGFILYSSIYKKMFTSKARLYYEIQKRCSSRKYIIQQGIDLLQVNGRNVDFRIVLLKSEHKWKFIGIMGKSAAKYKFVTNHASGGHSIRFKQALKEGLRFTDTQCEELEEELQSVSLDIAHSLNESYLNITELGLDIAIDKNKKIWLLEANTKPQFKLFKNHEDKSLYPFIMNQTKQLRSLS